MAEKVRQYVAIDAKSFYASVECVERHLNPMPTTLVVADESRTEKTICLAVSPALKAHKIPGRPRLFEVIQRIQEVNRESNTIGSKCCDVAIAQVVVGLKAEVEKMREQVQNVE